MFSVLTSKIFGGLLVAALAVFAFDEIGDARDMRTAEDSIAARDAKIADLKVDLATARSNAATLRSGLHQCNAAVESAAAQRSAMARAGAAAVDQVRRAGESTLAATRRRLEKMPTDGSTPAQQCQQVDDILLEGAAQ